MANTKKLIQAAAGAAGGEALNVEDVFSTYLYDGNSSTQTITNGIDLDGEGGLVWTKGRTTSFDNRLQDTETGLPNLLYSNSTLANITDSTGITSFNTNGYSLGSSIGFNRTNDDYASWTFRKAPKFFDVVTYTGDGVAGRSITHNLGVAPGVIIVKRTNSAENWQVYHRSLGADKVLNLNQTYAQDDEGNIPGTQTWYNTPTDSVFYVGSTNKTNGSGSTYVAYLFAHNDGDGDFGPTGDQDIIKCGSFTTNGSGDASVDLGFEPQWIIYKRSDGTSNWGMNDNMRGWADTYWNPLYADASNAESGFAATRSWPTATGFEFEGQLSASANYIYIAIRRGPMAVPESATDVFDVTTWTSSGEPKFQTSFPSDMAMNRNVSISYPTQIASRLTQGKLLKTDTTDAELSNANYNFDYMNGFLASGGNSDFYSWQWRRAPNFFDVVAYTGSATGGYATISHNLGVVPEMVWFKNRSSSTTPRGNWYVYHKDLVNSGGYVYLNSASAEATDYSGWASSIFAPSATGFTVLASRLHYTNENYIAYFFASVDGVSKVGSFTGNGSSTGDSQDIDCGFSSGARFVLVKAIGAPGAWFLFDTERGIVAGNDSHLSLNNTAAEDTSRDLIDPYSSGFTINYHSDWGNQLNGNGQTYIFYAIA